MGRIALRGIPGRMNFTAANIATFPGATFNCCFPEAIGDANSATWYIHDVEIDWEERENGAWHCSGKRRGELSYAITIAPGEDVIEARLSLTNESGRPWKSSLAFNCFNPGQTEAVWDYECLRHWVGKDGELKRLVALPRRFGPRPAIQLYSVKGAPPGEDIPFVDNFRATPPDLALEGWMAIQSKDGSRLIAAASNPALFLFQNIEYSCIHSAPGFGALLSGETGHAVTRLYFVADRLEDWYQRMKADMAALA